MNPSFVQLGRQALVPSAVALATMTIDRTLEDVLVCSENLFRERSRTRGSRDACHSRRSPYQRRERNASLGVSRDTAGRQRTSRDSAATWWGWDARPPPTERRASTRWRDVSSLRFITYPFLLTGGGPRAASIEQHRPGASLVFVSRLQQVAVRVISGWRRGSRTHAHRGCRVTESD